MQHTSLHDVHAAMGARLVDFGGWRMPLAYGPILEEVATVRGGVGLFDLGHMGRLRVRGQGATALLDRVVTCFCAPMAVGMIRYGLLCREDGNPIDDLLVYRDPDGWSLVVNAANTERDLAWLREQARDFEAEIEDRTGRSAMIALQGPRSAAVLDKLLEDADLAALRYYRFTRGTLCGIPGARISRTGYTGEDGFEAYFDDSEAERVWNALLEAGEPEGLSPIGLAARDTLRLEAGMSLYGHEIDAEHNPIEAGLAFAVSFDPAKGEWIGREALERVAAAPGRALVGLTTDGKRVPRQGHALFVGEREVGRVCSGAVSPTLGTHIATAYLPTDLGRVGAGVDLDIRGKRQACTVVALPFYSRPR